jgi:tyrosinase
MAGAPGELAQLRRRKSVDELTADDLAALRSAYTAMEGLSDDRGFGFWAGIHGLPLPISCKHHNPLFLPWHRAYLYLFEQALLDQSADAGLPWWDWTAQTGVPRAYDRATLDDGSANPLASGPVTGIPATQFQQAGLPPETATFRQPDVPATLPSPQQIDDVLDAADFTDFTERIEDIHDGVHVWTGGTMSLVPLAAYDPLFWAHHTMIDRIWWLWQIKHPGADPPSNLLDLPLAPFPALTVRRTLDIATLGYDYAASVSSAVPA